MKRVCGKPVFDFSDEEIEILEEKYKVMTEHHEKELKKAAFYSSGINADSYDASFDHYVARTTEQAELCNAVMTLCQKNILKALVLCGKNGTGKTYASACCIRELGGKYRKSIEICTEYEDANKPYAREHKSQVLERYTSLPFLVIDEVNRTPNTFEREVISYIVSERLENGRKTIVIGNCNTSELGKVLDAAVMSRISKDGMVLELNGNDRRQERI